MNHLLLSSLASLVSFKSFKTFPSLKTSTIFSFSHTLGWEDQHYALWLYSRKTWPIIAVLMESINCCTQGSSVDFIYRRHWNTICFFFFFWWVDEVLSCNVYFHTKRIRTVARWHCYLSWYQLLSSLNCIFPPFIQPIKLRSKWEVPHLFQKVLEADPKWTLDIPSLIC